MLNLPHWICTSCECLRGAIDSGRTDLVQQEPAAWQGRRERPSPGWVNSRRGKATGKKTGMGKRRRKRRRDGRNVRQRMGRGNSAKEETKHGTKKGLDAGFSKTFPQFSHGCKPLVCPSLVLDAYHQWEHPHPGSLPGSRCPALPAHGHERLAPGGGKRNHSVIFFFFFSICFAGEVLFLERRGPVKMAGCTQ